MPCIHYAFAQPGIGQHPVGLQSDGLQFCWVHCCLAFLPFLGLPLVAKAPVANVHTIASIRIFFILIYFNDVKYVCLNKEGAAIGWLPHIITV